MNQHHLKLGGVFVSLVLFCLCALSVSAQDETPITAANAGNLQVVATVGDPVAAESLAYSPDNQTLALCVVDGGIQLWNTATSAARLLIDVPCKHIAFSPDGTLIATTDLREVSLYDVATQAKVGAYPGSAFAFSPDGRALAIISDEGVLTIYAAPPGSAGASLPPTTVLAETAIPFSPTDTPPTNAATAVPVMPTPVGPTCTLTTNGETNLRSGPGTSFDRTGLVVPNVAIEADAQARGTEGATRYRLTSNEWVRANLVRKQPECDALPVVAP